MPTKVSQLINDSGYAKSINMSQNNDFSDSYVGKAKFAFQEEESLAIGKNATVKANIGDVAIGANTSTNERYDVNINNELLHNVEENIWEGKITEASLAYTNENGTNLTQLDVVIEDLATEIENRKNADETLRNNINTEIQNITEADVNLTNSINDEIQNRTDADTNLSNRITHIEDLLPNQVSSSNQLADKAFVNSSIQTNTANFRGNWNTWSDVPSDINLYPQDYEGDRTPTVNDYLVIQNASDYPSDTLVGEWRFKYTGVWSTNGKNGWIAEYQVNEEPFTSEQMFAINSGITSAKVSSYDSHLSNKNNPHSVTKSQVGLGSVVNTGDSATPVSGGTTKFTTGGAYTELNKKVDKINGKGLSTNDFTNTYKNKLDNIDTTVTTDSSNLVTSGAVATTIATYATKNDIGNKVNYGFTSMVDLGFTQGSYVSVRDFWTKIYAKYSKGNGVIQIQWAVSKSANLGTSTNYVTINGGTLIYTCNSPNNTWSDFSAIYINGGGDTNKVYHIKAHISDNTTAGAERWGIYTLTNTEYINSKLNSPLPWSYNYLDTGYSSSLHYRKIGEGYFNYSGGNWSFYSEIEMLYHRPNFFERGTIYITMRGARSSINDMNVRYQYKNGTSVIQLLSNTKVNYKVDTTNKRIYLELLAYCNSNYTMILFRNSLTRTSDMLLTENYFWTFAPTASYVQSSDTMQAGITDGYTRIPMEAFNTNSTNSYIENHTLFL